MKTRKARKARAAKKLRSGPVPTADEMELKEERERLQARAQESIDTGWRPPDADSDEYWERGMPVGEHPYDQWGNDITGGPGA